MKPPANHVLVAVPERYISDAVPGQKRLLLPKGSDDWAAMTDDLKAGTAARIESDEPIPDVPVRQGLVLAVCEKLTDDMDLHTGLGSRRIDRMKVVHDARGKVVQGSNGRAVTVHNGYTDAPTMRTCADLTDWVEIGDTIRFDHTYLTDQNEVSPGVYSLPYVAIICRIKYDDKWAFQPERLHPIGGYLLLYRMWAEDVKFEEIDGQICKVRYGASGLLDELNVQPLPNEGVVAWVGSSLRGTTDKLTVGQHVVFHGHHVRSDKSRPLDFGQAFTDTIAGTEYLCVRQDYVLAVRQPLLTTNFSS